MPWTNYHSHSYYCDGKEAPEMHLQAAIEQQFHAFGCSSHAPVPFETSWNMKMDQLEKYATEIRRLQRKYHSQLDVYLGFEVDYIPQVVGPSSPWIQVYQPDYSVGSIHFVDTFPDGTPWEVDGRHQVFLDGLEQIFQGNPQLAIERYFALTRQMIEEDCPDMVGHLDKIKIQDEGGTLFSETADWYQNAVRQTLASIRKAGVKVEINTRGMYKGLWSEPYPSAWIIREMASMDIPMVLNADSHHPREISGQFAEAAKLLTACGVTTLWVLMDHQWQALPYSPEGYHSLPNLTSS
ncbi:MAG: histidinol-phosphatase [Bacteroidota bacterium]